MIPSDLRYIILINKGRAHPKYINNLGDTSNEFGASYVFLFLTYKKYYVLN